MTTTTPDHVDSERPHEGTDPGRGLRAVRVKVEPWDLEVGPISHLVAERERLASCRYDGFSVAPMSATIGGEITGLDLRNALDPELVAELRRALLDFKVLFFRDQPLSGRQHVEFAQNFGTLEVHPFLPANGELPELVRFEKHAEIGGYENGWHSDVSWRVAPSMGAILHAIEIPHVGGDTLFSDMYAAYDGLDDDLKARLEGLEAVHDFTRAFGRSMDAQARAEMLEKFPPTPHPVIRTHEETGKKLIYVNRFFCDHIVGLERDESDALIDLLSKKAEIVEYQCRFTWEQDSIAFWDNRAVQHYASSDYWPDRRVMERASIEGVVPR